MKDGFKNIDEVFKQTFEGFEADVDPSVWSNVQHSMTSGSGGVNSTPQVDPTAVAGVAGKTAIIKIVAGVALLGSIASTVYFVSNTADEKENVVAENVLTTNNAEDSEKEIILPVAEEKEESVVDNSAIEEESTTAEPVMSVETSKSERVDMTQPEEKQSKEKTPVVEGSDPVKNTATATEDKSSAEEKVKTTEPNVENPVKKDKPVRLELSISASVTKGKAPLTVEFDAQGNGVKYFWNFGDATGEVIEESPIHTFMNEGTYTVTLMTIDPVGNNKKIQKTIVVESGGAISSIDEIQNVITPNGDGSNDVLKVTGENIVEFKATIMNSKGEPVFEWNSIDGFWDGKDMSGNIMPKGTYYISGFAKGRDGKVHTIKSRISVLL